MLSNSNCPLSLHFLANIPWLQVTSKKDQEQYWADNGQPYHYVPIKEFVSRFKQFKTGLDFENELSVPCTKNRSHRAALVFHRSPVRKREIFKACFAKEWLLVKRNSFVYIFKTVQVRCFRLYNLV